MKPYPALMIVPTAEICPCVDKKKLIIEDNAVPNKTRSKISNSSKGRTHVCSEEARNKIRESHLRNIASYKSQEFRDKISKAVDYKKSKVSQFTLEGEYLRSFSSANEAEKFTSVSRGSILRCCKGKVKRAVNFIWRYYGKGI